MVWLGHSSYFVQVGGKRILVDPVFSTYAAPVPGMVRAFDGTSPYSIEDLPQIDAVLISHDHYNHLDYRTMKRLTPRIGEPVMLADPLQTFTRWWKGLE